jgi:hypothetical protein
MNTTKARRSARPTAPMTWELAGLSMDSCMASRGPGDPANPGTANPTWTVRHQHFNDLLVYLVEVNTDFTDGDGELAAHIEVRFALSYDVGSVEPSRADIRAFEASVLLHATPFVREFLASTTNRLGLPPFQLPLLRNPEIEALV